MAINVKSVLTSGLVAGAVICVSAITMVPVVGNQMDAVLSARGLPPLSNMDMIFFTFISFIFGMALMFLYAVLKPHFGLRTKSAVMAALTVWVLAYLTSNASLAVYGFMPVKLVVIGTIWGLMELLLAGMVGSRIYRDPII